MQPPPPAAGTPKRPVLSVVSAIFSPMPGLPMMFSAGTFTLLKRSKPYVPSAEGVAVVDILAGSDPTSGSVNAKAEISPLAKRGKYFFFCSSVPKSLRGWGTPMLWWADNQVTVL